MKPSKNRAAKLERRHWRQHVESCASCKRFETLFDLENPSKPDCETGRKIFDKLWKPS